MPTGQGFAAKAQIFLEADAAWGTRVITTGSALEFDDFMVDEDTAVIESRALHGNLGARALYQMGIKAAGSLAAEARYEGMAKLLAAITGKRGVFTLTNVAVQTGVYHIDKTVQGGTVSMSMEVDEGGIYKASGDCSVITGLVFPRAKFMVAAGEGDDAMLRWEADVLAKDKTPQTTAQYTAGVPAANQTPVFFHQSLDASFSDGSGDAVAGVNVIGVDIELENLLATRYFIAPAGKNIAQPLRNGKPKVTWTIRKEFTSWTIFDANKAHTDAVGGLKIKFDSGLQIPTSSPSTNYSLQFDSPKAKCIKATHRINDFGIFEQTATWQAYFDPTIVSSLPNGLLVVTMAQGKASEAVLGA